MRRAVNFAFFFPAFEHAVIGARPCLRVGPVSGSCPHDCDETAIGFVDGSVGAYPTTIGDTVTVRLLTSSGTFKAIASEAVAVSAILYGAASGKVTDTDGGSYTARFLALSAGSADGSIIEVLPLTLS